MSKRLDPEIKALRAIHRAFQPLDIDARDRVLVWALLRMVEEPRRRQEKRNPGGDQ